jgi:hypothetical protein
LKNKEKFISKIIPKAINYLKTDTMPMILAHMHQGVEFFGPQAAFELSFFTKNITFKKAMFYLNQYTFEIKFLSINANGHSTLLFSCLNNLFWFCPDNGIFICTNSFIGIDELYKETINNDKSAIFLYFNTFNSKIQSMIKKHDMYNGSSFDICNVIILYFESKCDQYLSKENEMARFGIGLFYEDYKNKFAEWKIPFNVFNTTKLNKRKMLKPTFNYIATKNNHQEEEPNF